MSKNIFDDEPFRDGQPELVDGKWTQPDTYTPVPENTIRAARAIQKAEAEEEFDVEGLIEQVAEDDEEDFTEVLSDARLRLEQGKLYEMIMNHDLFGGVESDPRAAKSVQKQIRNFARERMEIMLGIRQEQTTSNNTTVISPFNSLEVQILKELASAASKGATETEEANQPVEASEPPAKKRTLNTISSGTSKTTPKAQPRPMAKTTQPIKRQTKPKAEFPPEFEMEYTPLNKPINEMTAAELAERDRQATERQKNRMVITPASQRQNWPSYEEQVGIAQAQVSRATNSLGKGNLSALIVANLKNAGKL